MIIKHKKRIYFLLTALIICMVLGIQMIAWQYQAKNEGLFRTVNYAGRQRMLSQKIAKQVLGSDKFSYQSLNQDFEEWRKIHDALILGSDSLGFPIINDNQIITNLAETRNYIKSSSNAYFDYQQEKISLNIFKEVVKKNDTPFLLKMDEIVFLLEQYAEGRLLRSQITFIISSLVILLLLVGIHIIIANPFIKYLVTKIEELKFQHTVVEKKNEEIELQNEQLTLQNELFQRVEEELNATLEEQTILNCDLNEKLDVISRQQTQMEDAQNLAQIGYWSYDLGEKIWWSENMYTIFDIPYVEERLGPTLDEFKQSLHPEDIETVFKNVEEVIANKELRYVHRVIDRKGKIKYINSLLKARYDVNGKPVEVYGVVQNITHQQNREDYLKRSNENLQALFDFFSHKTLKVEEKVDKILAYTAEMLQMETGILSRIDGDNYIVERFYNHSENLNLEEGSVLPLKNTCCEITYTRDNILDISHFETSEFHKHPCHELFKMESYIGITIFTNKGKRGTLSFTSSKPRQEPFEDYEKEFLRILAQMIGSIIETHEHIIGLEALNQDKENLLYVIAHDLRSPLSNIYGLIKVLKLQADPSDDEQNYIFEMANKEYNQGINMMEDLLESFDNTGKSKKKEKINISNFLDEIIESNRVKIESKSLIIKSSIIPAVEAYIFPSSLKRAIENLLNNSLKFTPEGGELFFMLFKGESYFTLIVADTGIGIPKSMQKHLFQKFSSKIRRKGLKGEKTHGLGMSIVKEIIDKHGGTINIESDEGKGTSISITIPLALILMDQEENLEGEVVEHHEVLVASEN